MCTIFFRARFGRGQRVFGSAELGFEAPEDWRGLVEFHSFMFSLLWRRPSRKCNWLPPPLKIAGWSHRSYKASPLKSGGRHEHLTPLSVASPPLTKIYHVEWFSS